MASIEQIRHSLAHILAAVVKKQYPRAKLGIGPAIENGFYYDFDFSDGPAPTPDDLKALEKGMFSIVNKKVAFNSEELSVPEAKNYFKDEPYKLELIGELETKGEKLTFFRNDDFLDLCAGPHIKDAGEIASGSFKLERLAGAYWKGDEKNKMLTRIYGLAFATKEELTAYETQIEEAKKRDHKKIGHDLELFMFHETAPGMPYWLPKGLILYNELVNYWRVEHQKLGYQEISSPLVNKSDLWKISGHWDHYKDDMFIADMGENEVYGIKPMNCPNAMVVFQSRQVSYKDLPLRLSDTDRLHRYERSGTLNGLLRVRSFQQDDSHNFISEDMIGDEYEHIFQICKDFYGIFGLEYSFRLGTRPESFLGEKEVWDKAEAELKKILERSGKKYIIAEGDGAFYGPKIDIVMKDCLGRDWQLGTLQLDFQLPRRFNLEYTDRDGQKKTPVVVHRVIYGSLERFIGILIEHTAGNFPVWLSPVQVIVLPISDKQLDYAKVVSDTLKKAGIRVELDESNETLGKKIRNAKVQKPPYILVIGAKEEEEKMITAEKREGGSEKMSTADFITKLTEEIKERK
ncbi:MAG: threonine--tRNA ligase [Candidatus Vogelbacteria bacterium]|nr:threonine--tRNA ligase [Candidatus Vogelbacteria bacterium]